MSYEAGARNGKHYWLTPTDLMAQMQAEFNFNFDACPYPKPSDFDGLKAPWGSRTYVNPPFGSYVDEDGRRKGPTAWARKSIAEFERGNKVVLVYPIDKWVHMLLEAGAQVRNLRDVKWQAIEDGSQGPGLGRWVAMFVLDPERK